MPQRMVSELVVSYEGEGRFRDNRCCEPPQWTMRLWRGGPPNACAMQLSYSPAFAGRRPNVREKIAVTQQKSRHSHERESATVGDADTRS
jgi:hypothetical protein